MNTITVYDECPATSGPCAWPQTFNCRAGITAHAKRRIRKQAKACGEYTRGDSLWLICRDDDGITVSSAVIEV